jgi:hypothetical protein
MWYVCVCVCVCIHTVGGGAVKMCWSLDKASSDVACSSWISPSMGPSRGGVGGVGGAVVSGSKGVECSVWKRCTNEACKNGMFVDFSYEDTQDVLHWQRGHALMREEEEEEEEEEACTN